jgi:hypothetical protein
MAAITWIARAATPGENLPVNICVYNYAGVPGSVLDRAQATAGSIFAKAGLHVTWHACPGSEPACSTRRGPDHVEVRLLLSEAVQGGVPLGRAGFAIQPTDGTGGTLANILADRAKTWTLDRRFDLGTLLGHIIAHEAGHLFLGAGRHSPHGLMASHWSPRELIQAMQGVLVFSREEGERMRARVREFHAVRLTGGNVSSSRPGL